MMPWVVRPLEPWIGPITEYRKPSPFKATWRSTLDVLGREIWHLGGRRWILQVDVAERYINRDGSLSARAAPASPAIRVCFESKHGPMTYQADRFWHWQDNVRAVALGLEALRKVDRYGIGGSGEQYRGWTAISNRPAEMSRDQAAEFIAHWAHPDDTERQAAAAAAIKMGEPADALAYAYRLAARRVHPDVTRDDGDTMARLNGARDLLLNGGRR